MTPFWPVIDSLWLLTFDASKRQKSKTWEVNVKQLFMSTNPETLRKSEVCSYFFVPKSNIKNKDKMNTQISIQMPWNDGNQHSTSGSVQYIPCLMKSSSFLPLKVQVFWLLPTIFVLMKTFWGKPNCWWVEQRQRLHQHIIMWNETKLWFCLHVRAWLHASLKWYQTHAVRDSMTVKAELYAKHLCIITCLWKWDLPNKSDWVLSCCLFTDFCVL